MKVVILAGGYGSRLAEETEVRPKPMVEIGGYPILWHIMKGYAHHGFDDFVLALGYKGEVIKRFFLEYAHLNSSFTLSLPSGDVKRRNACQDNWTVDLVDTGIDTLTAGRVKRVADLVGNETFMVTYGDGVANIDVNKLLDFHRSHGKLATVTAVRPPARFGELIFDGDQVTQFNEKPQLGEGWINGGFFVLEPAVLELISGDQTALELDPLDNLVANGQLMAYRHDDFWQCMDTVRDRRLLQKLWDDGSAPWKVWS